MQDHVQHHVHVSAEDRLTHCAAPTAAACCGHWLLSHRGVQSVWQQQRCQAGLWLSQARWVGTKHLQQLGSLVTRQRQPIW